MTLSTSQNERSTVVWERPDGVPTCVLGLLGQVNKFDSNHPLLTVLGLLDLFAT